MNAIPEGVAVIIAAKDAAATIARAVESALAQPEASEVIVVDDGSADATADVAAATAAGSERLILKRLAVNAGPSAARNLALSVSRSPFVCILDADDYMQPGRLGRLLSQIYDRDVVADDLLRVIDGDADGAPAPVIGVQDCRDISLADFLWANISRPEAPRAEWGFLKPLFRRAFLAGRGLAYDERVRLGEDFLLYANALARGAQFGLIPPCGYVAVERQGSLSHSHTVEDLRALLQGADALSRLPMDAEARRALAAYRGHLARKLHHREVLAARKAQGMLGALKALSRSPSTAGYVLGQTLNDKLGRARSAGRQDASVIGA